jgi:hypothetical protein
MEIKNSGGSGMLRGNKFGLITGRGIVLGIAIGLIIGLMAGGLWPRTPLHASATDRTESIIIATGQVDVDVEAIYILDTVSGELQSLVMSKNAGQFCGFFSINVAENLGIAADRNPKYAMVTGNVNLRSSGSIMQPSQAVVYVAEASSGKVGAYVIPVNPSKTVSGQKMVQKLVPVAIDQFRQPIGGVVPATTPTGRR